MPSSRAEQPPPAPGTLEEAVQRQARRFEPHALFRLVQRLWPGRAIRLRSKRSHGPEPTAVESIRFGPDRITLTLNIGLQSSTSPLPSYFQEMEADPRVGPALRGLVERIDDGLLRARLEANDAGAGDWLVRGGRVLAEDVRSASRLASPSGLWWLFSRVFPELSVSVRRGLLGAEVVADEARVGFAMLGSAMLGGSFAAPVDGFDVVLRITAVDTWTEEDWPGEVSRRLPRSVWPALRGSDASLRVWLVDPRGGAAMRLGGGRVGVEALALATRPGVSLVFEGSVPDLPDPEGEGR